MLDKATEYFKEDRYPNPHYCLPAVEEIEEVLQFTEELLVEVCKVLEIDMDKLKG